MKNRINLELEDFINGILEFLIHQNKGVKELKEV
jgi:hypothetical protein